ncbi:MAG: NifB/NifX family molybdenum-iron cluster-binding protein [Planctomycetota bacterium]
MTTCIAIPIANDRVSGHFGHADRFAFVTIDDDQQTTRFLTPPPHAPGVLPRWLADNGAQVVIAGGMGPKAVQLLEQAGIHCLLGVPDLSIDEAIQRYRQEQLPTGQVQCNHDSGHSCTDH